MASKIYTKKGDEGQTGLVSGTRVYKDDPRLELYGDLDELGAFLGVVSTLIRPATKFQEEYAFLFTLQNRLFNLGSLFACEAKDHQKFGLTSLTEEEVADLEGHMDRMDKTLPPLRNFVLPGGSLLNSYLHICRTVCRRVERKLVSFARENPEEIPAFSGKFLNRLSDYFFVLARWISFQEGVAEILWVPKKGQKSI